MSERPLCRICGAPTSRTVVAHEMMFGTRDAFDYHECDRCGCVQIAGYPEGMGKYYPAGYYSFESGAARPARPLERWLRRHRARYALGHLDPVGMALDRLRGQLEAYRWLRVAGATLESSILDVGCGNGFLLANLEKEGFRRLQGVDPFASDSARDQGAFVIKRSLAEVTHHPDFVLMSHSLEHMPDQAGVFRALAEVAGDHTWLCIRVPLANAAWQRYGVDWVQLDPPRHFYLHTERSLRLLAERAGFDIVRTDYDSSGLQFWGSEQIRRGIPFADERGHAVALGGRGTVFSPSEIAAWEAEAIELNHRAMGDQATFYLRRRNATSVGFERQALATGT
jgi:SAM-dependent methyltransferase